MVVNGKSYQSGWLGGTPRPLGNHHIDDVRWLITTTSEAPRTPRYLKSRIKSRVSQQQVSNAPAPRAEQVMAFSDHFHGENMGMDQYLLIPFLGGWISIYQLFWCEQKRGTRFWHTAIWENDLPSNFVVPVPDLSRFHTNPNDSSFDTSGLF